MKKISLLLCILSVGLLLSSFKPPNKPQRVRLSLNNAQWKFLRSDIKNGFKKSVNDASWLDVKIPHDFNGGSDGLNYDVFKGRFDFKNDPDQRTMYKGPAWYRTKFNIDENYKNKQIFLEFEAVSLQAEVWVNGKKAGTHQGGYTAFSCNITELVKPGNENLLAVRVDNSNNPNIAPWMADEKNSFPYSFDYAVYGGIYRDVWLCITESLHIENVFNTPVVGGQAPAVASVETRLKNHTNQAREFNLKTSIYNPKGELVSTLNRNKTIEPKAEMRIKQSESSLGDIYFWSPDTPNIYRVVSEISANGQVIDQYESIFGFRYYSLANHQAFMLNDKKTFIKGINRHQDMEGLGYALSNEQHIADAQLIKDAGFNFIRHAHYPADQAFAKACAELGIMLWFEIPLTGSTSETPEFLENCKQQLTEMIEQHYNNPAVIIWGIGNESDRSGGSETVSNKVFSELTKTAHQLDQNRMVTGCNYQFKSNQDIVDIYAPQDWSGWYSGVMASYNPKEIIGEYGADMDVNLRTIENFDIAKNYSAGSKPDMWTQEYGALLHEYKTSVGLAKSDSFPGHFVWVAFDFASPRLGRGTNPIPYMNQKGLIAHNHKTKKDAYYFYQSMYRNASDYPMLYIVPGLWSQQNSTDVPAIWAYSNCDSVVLFNGYNKNNLGTRTKNAGPRGDTRFQWNNVSLTTNIVYAEAWFENKIVARDTVFIKNK